MRLWWNYKWSPELTLGGGLSGGILEVEESATQAYEQALGRMTYSATDKLSFELDGGIELRQTDETARATPVFSLTGTYLPFAATQLQLSAYRHVENSAVFVGEDYTATGVKLEARHTWRGSYDLILAAAYEHSDYQTVSGSSGPSRQDNAFVVRPAVQCKLRSWAQVELFCEYRHNASTLGRFSFRDSQVGLQVTFAF
ncbi:MAG: outer membrane beta-barrel protein [Chthoniobacterales bacterium]|nr:outer membrane beta-barrel protein [Chthoniobacterales bacterium]